MKKRYFLQIFWKGLSLASRYIRKYLFLSILFLALQTVMYALTPVFNNKLFDAIEAVTKHHSWTAALPPLLLLGAAVTLEQVFNRAFARFINIAFMKGEHAMQIPLNEVCGQMEPVEFEDPEILDQIGKAVSGATKCPDFVISLLFILGDIPHTIILGIYFYTLRPMLAWSVLLVFIPIMLSQILKITLFKELEDEVAPIRRENDYYDRCISHRDYFKETRLLGGYFYFAKKFRESLNAYCKIKGKKEVRSGLYELISHILTLCGYIGVLFLLFDSVMNGYITIGAFAAAFASIGALVDTLDMIITYDIGDAMKSYGAVRNFIEFVSDPPAKKASAVIKNRGLVRLENVRFTYPGANQETIKGITFEIHPGETLAVVGENGAGKSTLMRLITGQYLATSGTVTADGQDLSQMDMPSRFAGVSATFQKFGRYRMTATENITLSTGEFHKSTILRCASDADVHLDDKQTFPQGMDTMLSREFGGVDLSGGQWQRVAVARGLYRNHSLIILDEPTAAIDPVEETRLYKRFSEISHGKTSIIVTHRLGSARIADRILVLRDGQIDDVGTHEELISKGGYYARLYESQAEWYA